MIDLLGRRVLVSGGSRGIGAACCRQFARAGAAVAIHYCHNEDAAREVARQVEGCGRESPLLLGADLTVREEVGELVADLERRWDHLDCLVNNAGVWVRNELALLDESIFEDTWKLNVQAPFLLASTLLPLLRKGTGPNIINISSTAGQRGEAFHSPYAASKGALISATKSWAAELAPHIRVNSVAPGWVDTDMSASTLTGESRRAIESTIPLGRVATAEEIAGPVLFLASPLASDVTGEILNVNGGGVLCG